MSFKAYILRTCNADDMSSRNDFVWPREGVAEAPDWKPTKECGNGLHGALWGEGDGSLLDWSPDAVWVVAGVDEWIDLDGKVKFPRATVVFAGARNDATAKIIALGARGAVIGAALAGGNDSTLTGGDGSILTGGNGSTLIFSYWDGERRRLIVAYVGENGVEPGRAYSVRDGKLVEASA